MDRIELLIKESCLRKYSNTNHLFSIQRRRNILRFNIDNNAMKVYFLEDHLILRELLGLKMRRFRPKNLRGHKNQLQLFVKKSDLVFWWLGIHRKPFLVWTSPSKAMPSCSIC